MDNESYERSELLAEPEWLWTRRDDPTVRIIDCGDPGGYDRAHIPGAVALHQDVVDESPVPPAWLKDPANPLHVIGADDFAAIMARCGVGDATTVVAYDDRNGTGATRLWWVLTYYGHGNVKVLNGGWQRWLDDGRPVTFRSTTPEPTQFTARVVETMRVRLDELRRRYAEPGLQIVNALWPEMYRGEDNEFGNQRVGHIPGSVNLPIERLLNAGDVPTLRSAEDLQVAMTEVGLSPERETIVHCHAGVRTTMVVFALSLLGWDSVRAYDASMAEWANREDTALEVG